MRAARYLAAVDSHTEGMPTRVVTGGVEPLPGGTMLERKLHFDRLRAFEVEMSSGGRLRCRVRVHVVFAWLKSPEPKLPILVRGGAVAGWTTSCRRFS